MSSAAAATSFHSPDISLLDSESSLEVQLLCGMLGVSSHDDFRSSPPSASPPSNLDGSLAHRLEECNDLIPASRIPQSPTAPVTTLDRPPRRADSTLLYIEPRSFKSKAPSTIIKTRTSLDLHHSSVLRPSTSPEQPHAPISPLYTSVMPPSIRVTRSSSIHKLSTVRSSTSSFSATSATIPALFTASSAPNAPLSGPKSPMLWGKKQDIKPLKCDYSSRLAPLPPPKRSASRPEGHTPRPPNAWILYRSEQLRSFKQDPELARKPQSDISKLVGLMWRSESDETKAWFGRQADLAKIEHAERYPGYIYTPNRRKKPSSRDSTPGEGEGSGSRSPTPNPLQVEASRRSASGERKRRRAASMNGSFVAKPSWMKAREHSHVADVVFLEPDDDYSFLDLISSADDSHLEQAPCIGIKFQGLRALDSQWIKCEDASSSGTHASIPIPFDWNAPQAQPYNSYPPHPHHPLSAPAVMNYFDFSSAPVLQIGTPQDRYSKPHGYTTGVISDLDALSPLADKPFPLLQNSPIDSINLSPVSSHLIASSDAQSYAPSEFSGEEDDVDINEYLAYREMEERLSLERAQGVSGGVGFQVPMHERISYSFPTLR